MGIGRAGNVKTERKGSVMTNRDYLMGLSNETLSEFILRKKSEICYSMQACCCGNCLECFTKWLEMERKPNVGKGQIRQADSGRCYLTLMVADTECLIISEKGVMYRRLKSVVDTWVIRNDISINEFVERIFNNL